MLALLWLVFVVLTVVAFFAILLTGRYPRGLFDLNVGILRWTWRVQLYATAAIGTDRYPPFTLDHTDYPADLDSPTPSGSRAYWVILLLTAYVTIGTAGPVVAATIGMGVGIDYALLVVTRHREDLAGGHSAQDSIPIACRPPGGRSWLPARP